MKRFKFIFIFLLITLITLLFVYISNKIKVSEVICINQYGNCSDAIYKDLSQIKNLNFISTKKKVRSQLSVNPLVKNYSLEYKIPNKIVVHLVERKAEFALQSIVSGKTVLVDADGRILSFITDTVLPKVQVDSDLQESKERTTQEELFSLKLVSHLYSIFKISQSKVEGKKLEVFFTDGTKAIFPLEGDKEVLLGSLILILNKIKDQSDKEFVKSLEGKQSLIIDLRYENPIIR